MRDAQFSGDSREPRAAGCAPASHGLGIPLSKVGFPIRKSADQSFFAAPRGLSQRSTSFIASQRQGIHRMPLRHLIALIINAHHASAACTGARGSGRTLMRKTSLLLQDRPDGVRSSSPTLISDSSSASQPRRCGILGCRVTPQAFARTILGSIPSSRCQTTALTQEP